MAITVQDTALLTQEVQDALGQLVKLPNIEEEVAFITTAAMHLTSSTLTAFEKVLATMANSSTASTTPISSQLSNDLSASLQEHCKMGIPILSRDSDGNPMAAQISNKGNYFQQLFLILEKNGNIRGGIFPVYAGADFACQNLINGIPKKSAARE